MNAWIILSVGAYFCMALSQLLDKVLLRVAFREVKAFVFLIALLNLLALVLIPFGVTWLEMPLLLLALAGGALFIIALIPFLSALQGDDASRIIPFVGAVVPIATLVGDVLFLEASFSSRDILAFILLVVGSYVLTLSPSSGSRRSGLALIKGTIGAILFAASFVITKAIYLQVPFIDGFFWMRIGGLLVAAILLMRSDVRSGMMDFFKKNTIFVQSGYFATQALNGLGFILQNVAISIASVTLVNALQGSQYLFLVVLVVLAARVQPELLGEKIDLTTILQKLVSIFIIIAGIALLAF